MVDQEAKNDKKESDNNDVIVIAICTVTGTHGHALVERLAKVNELRQAQGQPLLQVRGLTRDPSSAKAQALLAAAAYSNVSLVQVDYGSRKSLRRALKGSQGLYLHCSLAMTGQYHKVYERIIDCAIQVGVRHIVYASHMACDRHNDHPVPPQWEEARHTEAYLAIRQDEESAKQSFTYHILRYPPLLHDHVLQLPHDDSWIAFAWHPSVRVHTVSAVDGARVAWKLLEHHPTTLLKNGAVINIMTDYKSPHEIAQTITLRRNTTQRLQAYKGPASLVTMGALLGNENKRILAMGEYIEQHWSQDHGKQPTKYCLQDVLKEELEAEPLETLDAFVERVFSSTSTAKDAIEQNK
jgi:nucleoside-diphosphate-sugar epimerase